MLLERVFLRLGSAETDEQLEAALAKFLAPALLKLASQADGVRKKVKYSYSFHALLYTVFRKKHPLTFSSISPWKMYRFTQNFQGMFTRS